jgi:tetratricopeptide (TPR) repeat protein
VIRKVENESGSGNFPGPQHEDSVMFKKFLLAAILGCLCVAGSSGEAAAQTKKATTSNKKIEALYKKAADLLNEKEFDEAMEVVDQIIELDANQSQAWGIKAWLYNHNKEFKQGEKAAKKAVSLNDEFVFAWYELGYAQLNLKKFEPAAESFEKVIELNPKQWQAYDSLALALKLQGQEDEAEKWTKLKTQRMAKEKKATPKKVVEDDDN